VRARKTATTLGGNRFSSGFQTFVRANIGSVEQVDVLLLLYGDPTRYWTVDEISGALQSSPSSIAQRMRILCSRGLACRDDDRYRYQNDDKLDPLVAELQREYRLRPVSIIELIYSRRNAAIESFADAFRITGDDHDG
jgi:hypothetical protein